MSQSDILQNSINETENRQLDKIISFLSLHQFIALTKKNEEK